jgi:hypothetical protein
MFHSGRLLADFKGGTRERPEVPEAVSAALTRTVAGHWVVCAYKSAWLEGDLFRPLHWGEPYPADAVAECGQGRDQSAPQPGCTCGFYAVSSQWPLDRLSSSPGQLLALLQVALSGRTLAFDCKDGFVLFRAERQTFVRLLSVRTKNPSGWPSVRRQETPKEDGPTRLQSVRSASRQSSARVDPPDDPSGQPSVRRPVTPIVDGAVRVQLPRSVPRRMPIRDDVGYGALVASEQCADSNLVMA